MDMNGLIRHDMTMPSTIVPINVTRTSAIKPARGLRYGNFEGVRNLPPVRSKGTFGEHSLWSLNNEHIYRTVCQWMETWQPWQQRTLLCGVANRCTVSQLEILSTTLEPLRHRDYKTVSLSRYPSASFKVKKPEPETESPSRRPQKKHGRNIPLIIADDVGNITDVKKITSPSKKRDARSPKKDDGYRSHLKVETDQNNNHSNGDVSKITMKGSEKMTDKSTTNKNATIPSQPEEAEAVTVKSESEETVPAVMNIDQYSSVLSSSILISAINDAATLMFYDQHQFQAQRETSNVSNSKVKIMEPVESQGKESQALETQESAGKLSPRENILNRQDTAQSSLLECQGRKSTANSRRSRPMTHSSGRSSARFLGGTLEFSSIPYRRGRSSSTQFRHSAFGSSVATTADYFNRKKLAVLGPMQHPMRTGSVQKPLMLGSLPVSLQKYYKNSRWWPAEPSFGKIYHQARKHELATNFKDQLMTIWDWLSEWEGHERIAFIKEIAKICPADVLDALLTHIQQRLRDSRDINRLSDKLLLYIFSFLSPRDILQSSQVCRRWRYLCAMDDLWTLKCLEVGEREGISNMIELIQQANKDGMSVDWMLAYTQLNKLMDTLKASKVEEDAVDGSSILPDDDEDGGQAIERIWTGIIKPTAGNLSEGAPSAKVTKRSGKGRVSIRLNTGVREKLEKRRMSQMSTDDQGEVRRRRDSRPPDVHEGSETDSAFSEEDLSPLLDEYNMLRAPDTPDKTVPRPHWSKTMPGKSESKQLGLFGSLPEETTPATSSRGRNMSSKASSEKKKEDEKDVALDIRTDLGASKDLLGKMVSHTNLEWETPETYNDYMRTTLYAGDVVAVKRMRKLQGHVNCINCVYFDTRRLVTCGLDRVIRLWDVRSGRSLHKFIGHKGGIRCVQFDNDIMATGSWDCLVLIWDMREFTNIATLQGHNDSITCLEFNGDLLISGSEDKTVRLWRRPTFYCMLTIRFDAPVLSLIIIDHMFVVSTSDLAVQMFDVYTGTKRRKFEPPLGPVHCLAIHGKLLLGGDSQGRMCFWNFDTGELEAAVKVHDEAVNRVVYHNGRFYTASSDSTIKEWDLMTMTCLRVLKGHKGPVRDVKVSSRRIISCGDDATTRIWDLVLDTSKLTAVEEKPQP